MYWAAACGGCEIAVLNIHEGILDVDANFDVVFWPVAMDAKYQDVEAMEDGSITLCLFNGAIRNDENAEMAHLLRRKSKMLWRSAPAPARDASPAWPTSIPSRPCSTPPSARSRPITPRASGRRSNTGAREGDLHIPYLFETVRTLDQVVRVDYYMPGCPPESPQIAAVVGLVIQALKGEAQLAPAGSVLGVGNSTVCDECPRKREEKTITEFRRMATFQPNPTDCLLEQGILCAGLATRSGCQARCPSANMPCIGCYGPAPDVIDQGARMMSAVASVIGSDDPKEIRRIMEGIVDPAGTFYKFSLPASLLGHARISGS